MFHRSQYFYSQDDLYMNSEHWHSHGGTRGPVRPPIWNGTGREINQKSVSSWGWGVLLDRGKCTRFFARQDFGRKMLKCPPILESRPFPLNLSMTI